MSDYAGINIRLSRKEFERLTMFAAQEMRHPRDQARFLLRMALLGPAESPPEPSINGNRAGSVLPDTSAVAP